MIRPESASPRRNRDMFQLQQGENFLVITSYSIHYTKLYEEKTERVRQHFNSVARHYDFMNTLLSFGIHYAWKRSAVRMLKLTPGDRVV